MSSTFKVYEAIIPAMYATDEDALKVREILTTRPAKSPEPALWVDENGDIHFRVDCMDGDEYALRYNLEGDPELSELRWVAPLSLDNLIRQNKICLMEDGPAWSSSDYAEEVEEGTIATVVAINPVEAAEKIPTLILQEVLAKRLEAD